MNNVSNTAVSANKNTFDRCERVVTVHRKDGDVETINCRDADHAFKVAAEQSLWSGTSHCTYVGFTGDCIRVEDGERVAVENPLDSAMIGDGATLRIHTDRFACTIIDRQKSRMTIQRDKAVLLNGVNSGAEDALEFTPGGFAGRTEGTQRYDYQYDEHGSEYLLTRRAARTTLCIGDGGGSLPTTEWVVSGHPTKSPGMRATAGRREHRDFNF